MDGRMVLALQREEALRNEHGAMAFSMIQRWSWLMLATLRERWGTANEASILAGSLLVCLGGLSTTAFNKTLYVLDRAA